MTGLTYYFSIHCVSCGFEEVDRCHESLWNETMRQLKDKGWDVVETGLHDGGIFTCPKCRKCRKCGEKLTPITCLKCGNTLRGSDKWKCKCPNPVGIE